MPLTLDPRTETEPLQQRLRQLRGRLCRIIVFREGSRIVLLALLFVMLFGWLDWRWQLPSLVRAFVLVGLLSGTALLTMRWVIGPLRRERGILAMAQRVERCFPDLNDALVSAVQFLETPVDRWYGSSILRQETIQYAIDNADDLDFKQAVPSNGLRRSLLALVAVLITGLFLFDASPPSAARALKRLLAPFGSEQWPAKTTIDILAPQPLPHRMAKGEWLELTIRLRGVIPDRVTVGLWLEGSKPIEQTYTIAKNEQSSNENTFTIRFEPSRIERNFRFRVRANDADTGWQHVDIHLAPYFVPRDGRPPAQIHLTYPAYTDLSPADLPDGSSAIEAVTGTRVRIKTAADRQVTSARFILKPATPRAPLAAFLAGLGSRNLFEGIASFALGRDVWNEIPVKLSGDGRLIDIDFVPHLSGAYTLRIEDETGIGSIRTFDVRVQPDPSPVLDLIRPNSLRESLALVPHAEFTLAAIAQDKIFALRQVFLEYRIGSSRRFQRIEYFDSRAAQSIMPSLSTFMAMPLRLPTAPFSKLQAYALVQRLSLKRFAHADGTPLIEGDVLTIRTGANDFDDVTFNKPPGLSPEIELQIVSTTNLDASLQQALAQMRNELLLLRELQQDARLKVQEALKHLEQSGRLDRDQIERLNQAEQFQQMIRAKINAVDEGLLAQTAKLKQTILDNHLPRSRATRRIDALADDLKRLADEEIEPIEPLLGTARKENDKLALTRAERHQKEVDETIRSLLERLEPWSGAGEVRGEARSILSELRKQIELNAQQLRSQKPTEVGSKRDELPKSVQDEIDRLAIRPERLAERLRLLLEKMDRLVGEKELSRQEKFELQQENEIEAKRKDAEATRLPKGSPAEQLLKQQAATLREEAANLRETADALQAEIDALKSALKNGEVRELQTQIQNVPGQVQANQLDKAIQGQQAAAARLEKLVEALDDRGKADGADVLQKKVPDAAGRIEKLIGDQELLQKKVEAAKQETDPMKRADELQKLAREQERLEKEAQELAQQLNRAGDSGAAQDLRRAARQMADAKQQLEQGQLPEAQQDESLERLDDALARVERDRGRSEEELIREQLTKAADTIRALRDRQQSAINEQKRIYGKAMSKKTWEQTIGRVTLPGLIEQQNNLAKEVRGLIPKRFDSVPVFARMLRQSAEAMEDAGERFKKHSQDVLDQIEGFAAFDQELEKQSDRAIRLKQEIALKRLDQLLEALKPEKEMFRPQPKTGNQEPMMADPPKAKPSDAFPPLAQLKALRSLQADLTEQTVAFDKAHSDRAKLSEDEAAELETIKKAQLDVAELARELTPAPMMGDKP